MLTLRHVKTVVIWLLVTLFSENTVMILLFIPRSVYSSRIADTGAPAGTIGNTFFFAFDAHLQQAGALQAFARHRPGHAPRRSRGGDAVAAGDQPEVGVRQFGERVAAVV